MLTRCLHSCQHTSQTFLQLFAALCCKPLVLVSWHARRSRHKNTGLVRQLNLAVVIIITQSLIKLSFFSSTLVNDSDGLQRILNIAKSRKKYMSKTLRSAHQLLTALWRFTSLRDIYRNKGYKESDFLSKTMVPRSVNLSTISLPNPWAKHAINLAISTKPRGIFSHLQVTKFWGWQP